MGSLITISELYTRQNKIYFNLRCYGPDRLNDFSRLDVIKLCWDAWIALICLSMKSTGGVFEIIVQFWLKNMWTIVSCSSLKLLH